MKYEKYTVGWWINLLNKSNHKKDEAIKVSYKSRSKGADSLADSWYDIYARYEDLSYWIMERVINKYGVVDNKTTWSDHPIHDEIEKQDKS